MASVSRRSHSDPRLRATGEGLWRRPDRPVAPPGAEFAGRLLCRQSNRWFAGAAIANAIVPAAPIGSRRGAEPLAHRGLRAERISSLFGNRLVWSEEPRGAPGVAIRKRPHRGDAPPVIPGTSIAVTGRHSNSPPSRSRTGLPTVIESVEFPVALQRSSRTPCRPRAHHHQRHRPSGARALSRGSDLRPPAPQRPNARPSVR